MSDEEPQAQAPADEVSVAREPPQTALRRFLATETGSAMVLLLATIASLAWVNTDPATFGSVWHTRLAIRVGGSGITQDLRSWINGGLMALFFFVVGLEARREFDIGELRERRRVAMPMLAGIGGMVGAVGLYLAVNAGSGGARAWGVAMSTDTAFALGVLALVGPRPQARLRAFILTVVVVDDLLALVVIATVYAGDVAVAPLLVALALLAGVVAANRAGIRSGALYAVLGVAAWIAMRGAGVDPVVVGLAMGLCTYATPPARADLERASQLFRLFREQPTTELARTARIGLESAISPNERLAMRFHPWTSFVIVPLFALTNAGIPISGAFLTHAYRSPVTLGILGGYLIGKPLGVAGVSALVARLSGGRLRLPVGWGSVTGAGTLAGIGFTVSLLIASISLRGATLAEAKLGILSAALGASLTTLVVFQVVARLPAPLRARALLGAGDVIVDLNDPVDLARDHWRGHAGAPVTLVEYGDFECPFCGRAESVVRDLLAGDGELRYVWRHLPLVDVHPHAQLAAEAAEAAAAQDAFWEMHALLFAHSEALRPEHLLGYAADLGLDVARFERDLARHAWARRIADDVDGADLSGVSGTPTFFINGHRHQGAYDITTLTSAVRVARARAAIASSRNDQRARRGTGVAANPISDQGQERSDER